MFLSLVFLVSTFAYSYTQVSGSTTPPPTTTTTRERTCSTSSTTSIPTTTPIPTTTTSEPVANCPTLGDSRCLSCASLVDCTSGTGIEVECPENQACGENIAANPPAFCSGVPQFVPDNSNCFCENGDNGLYEDPYSIYSYVSCSNGDPTYLDCPDGQAFIPPDGICVPVTDCNREGTYEIPLSCNTKLVCVYEYGDYTGTLEYCDSDEIFNANDPDYCYTPGEGVCTEPGNTADPYKCNIWHQCLNDSDAATSSCCPEDQVYSESQNECVPGECPPSGLCTQEYWEQEECHQCTSDGQKYETDNDCTPYYFECYLDAGRYEVRLVTCPVDQLYDPSTDQCSSSVSGC